VDSARWRSESGQRRGWQLAVGVIVVPLVLWWNVSVALGYVYWSASNELAQEGQSYWLSRAHLDGSCVNGKLVPAGGLTASGKSLQVSGLAVSGSHIYWTTIAVNGVPGSIGRANLNGSDPRPHFITHLRPRAAKEPPGPSGIVVAGPYIYWSDAYNATIGRANLDGTSPNQSFISGIITPAGVAVDANFIYWADVSSGTIGRANLDGTSPNPSFITGASSPFAVTVN